MVETFACRGATSQKQRAVLPVQATIVPCSETIQELLPQTFRFANEDHVSMSAGFLRQQRHMRATQYHAHSARPEPGRKTVGVISTRRVKRNAHKVGLVRPIDAFGLFIDVS